MFTRAFWRAFKAQHQFHHRLSAPYVLIGAGTASYFASMAIRARDPDAKVLIIGEEAETPYQRIPISKEAWWYGDENTPKTLSYRHPHTKKRKEFCYEADGFYLTPETMDEWPHGAVTLMRNARVARVDPETHTIHLADGKTVQFGKCLIATGSKPQLSDQFQSALAPSSSGSSSSSEEAIRQTVFPMHTVEDYRHLHQSLMDIVTSEDESGPSNKTKEKGKQRIPRVVVIGGGVLATELAYSLNRRFVRRPLVNGYLPQIEVVLVIPESDHILTDMLPAPLAQHATEELRAQGVEILPNSWISSGRVLMPNVISRNRPQLELKLSTNSSSSSSSISNSASALKGGENDSQKVVCDLLVLGVGADPRVEVAQNSGLPLDQRLGGIYTDEFLRVGKWDVWAAGDVASFYDPALRRRRRETHWEHAQTTGRQAGENMTGGERTYDHQSAFVSLVSPDVHITGVGVIDAHGLETFTVIADPAERSLPPLEKLSKNKSIAQKEGESVAEQEQQVEQRGSGKVLKIGADHRKADEEEIPDDEKQLSAVVFYKDLRTKRLVGVLTYNVFGHGLELSRKLVRDAKPHTDEELVEVAKLFDLFGLLEDDEEIETAIREAEEEKEKLTAAFQ